MPAKAKTETKVPAEKKKRVRREVNKESLVTSFATVSEKVNKLLLKCVENKIPLSQKIRSLGKSLRQLESDCTRVMKLKKKTNRAPNPNSGFNKPIELSAEMLKFTGWKAADPKSRADVTRFICAYIKEHKLQDKDDARNIHPNEELSTLLRWVEKDQKDPLTFFRVQKHVQHHFIKPPPMSAEAAKKKKAADKKKREVNKTVKATDPKVEAKVAEPKVTVKKVNPKAESEDDE